MSADETAHAKAKTVSLAIASLALAANLLPAVALAQAPPDPNAEKLKKQQQQQQRPPQGQPPGGPRGGPGGPQGNPVPRSQQGGSQGSFQGNPQGGPQGNPRFERRGPPPEVRRADPQGGQSSGQKQFIPPQGRPPIPPPNSGQGQAGQAPGGPAKSFSQPGRPPIPPPNSGQGQAGQAPGGPAKSFSQPGRPPIPPPNSGQGQGQAGQPPVGVPKSFSQPGRFPPPGGPGTAGNARPGVPVGNARPVTPPGGVPLKLDQVKTQRVQTAGPGGQTVIREPGNRTIVKQDNRVFVTRNEATTIKTFAPGARTTLRPGGVSETVFVRPGGGRVYTETDRQGRLLRRYRRDPGGREITFVDNRRFYRNLAIGAGAALVVGAVIVSLPRPALAIPREKYIVDYVSASDDDIYECLTAPPIERLDRAYSLDEIRYSDSLRDRVRRVDLDNINFELGSFEVTPDQYGKLERVARAMGRAIEANPAEVFLIEGHTDAVGNDEDNLSLSDRRAEAVAHILVEQFQIPIENLVTQGYGRQFLKIETSEPERANRRVAVRRITPLLSQQEQR